MAEVDRGKTRCAWDDGKREKRGALLSFHFPAFHARFHERAKDAEEKVLKVLD